MPKITSTGDCVFCGKSFSKSTINRHLAAHLKEQEAAGKAAAGTKSYLLSITQNPRWGSSSYFLALLVDADATLGEVDDFLREIWLECCGHLSSFRLPRKRVSGRGLAWRNSKRCWSRTFRGTTTTSRKTSLGDC